MRRGCCKIHFAAPPQKLLEGFALILRLFSRKNRIFWRSKRDFPAMGRCKAHI
jgi:hypothetical protein